MILRVVAYASNRAITPPEMLTKHTNKIIPSVNVRPWISTIVPSRDMLHDRIVDNNSVVLLPLDVSHVGVIIQTR